MPELMAPMKSASPDRALRVLLLVNNPCTNDARVIRQAEALAQGGYQTQVLAHWSAQEPEAAVKNGVHYRRIAARREDRVAKSRKAREASANTLPGSGVPVDAGHAGSPGPVKSAAQSTGALNLSTRIVLSLSSRAKDFAAGVVTGTLVNLLRHARHYAKPGAEWQPDIVHANDLCTLLAGYRIAKRTGAKLVYDSHELEIGRNGNFSKWERWIQARAEASLIHRADAVITVCDSIADFLKDRYAITRPTVIHNSPSISAHQCGDSDVRNHLELSADTPLAISVGKLTINRGIENCMRALVHAPDVHLVCIGPRVQTLADEIMAEAKELGVASRFHLVDPVPHDEVASFIRSADLSLITIQDVCLSYHFCFPNKLLESLLAGLPIVASKLPELEAMVARTGAGVTTDETDPEAIAKSMQEILADRQAFVPSSEQIETMRTQFGWGAQSERLLALYAQLAADQSGRDRVGSAVEQGSSSAGAAAA